MAANPLTPQDVGSRLLEVAYEVLTENLGREPGPVEFCEMVESMVSTLLASSYVELRGENGAEAAEKWLKKVLSMVSAGVRASGSDAFIHIDVAIKDVPNRIVRKAPEKPKEAKAPPAEKEPVCGCARTQGQCQSCQDALMEKFRGIYGTIKDLRRINESPEPCPVCCITEFDHALARLVPEFWKNGEDLKAEEKADFAKDLMGILAMTAAVRGISEIPVTLESWSKLAKENGVNPEA